MSCDHITSEQRNELSVLLRAGIKQKEIKRNSINSKYHARITKELTKNRRILANQRFRKIENNGWLRMYIIKKLKLYWSPEQISGRLKLDFPSDKDRRIGKDSIYKFVCFKRKDLVKYLRCQKGKYRRRYGTRIREKERERLKKKRIDVRPKIVESRSRVGDWEGDTIVGKDKSHILTHVDRRSGLLLADKLERGLAELTKEKVVKRFSSIPRSKKRTITYDNGSTFFEHEMIERKTKIDVYFAYPYHSWERGCNENCNGLIRQFFAKRSSFKEVKQKDIDKVVKLINNRPRKRLNYYTPREVFLKGELRSKRNYSGVEKVKNF